MSILVADFIIAERSIDQRSQRGVKIAGVSQKVVVIAGREVLARAHDGLWTVASRLQPCDIFTPTPTSTAQQILEAQLGEGSSCESTLGARSKDLAIAKVCQSDWRSGFGSAIAMARKNKDAQDVSTAQAIQRNRSTGSKKESILSTSSNFNCKDGVKRLYESRPKIRINCYRGRGAKCRRRNGSVSIIVEVEQANILDVAPGR